MWNSAHNQEFSMSFFPPALSGCILIEADDIYFAALWESETSSQGQQQQVNRKENRARSQAGCSESMHAPAAWIGAELRAGFPVPL